MSRPVCCHTCASYAELDREGDWATIADCLNSCLREAHLSEVRAGVEEIKDGIRALLYALNRPAAIWRGAFMVIMDQYARDANDPAAIERLVNLAQDMQRLEARARLG